MLRLYITVRPGPIKKKKEKKNIMGLREYKSPYFRPGFFFWVFPSIAQNAIVFCDMYLPYSVSQCAA